jgi:hypothetical protein
MRNCGLSMSGRLISQNRLRPLYRQANLRAINLLKQAAIRQLIAARAQ